MDADLYIEAIVKGLESNLDVHVPASVLVEAGIAAEQCTRGDQLDGLVEKIQPEVVPLDRAIADLARKAFRKFAVDAIRQNSISATVCVMPPLST